MRAGLPRDNFMDLMLRVIQMSTIFTLGGRMVRQWIANPLFTGSIPVLKSSIGKYRFESCLCTSSVV